MSSSPFNLIMLSAMHEGGGNVLHRHFDGHPQCMTYPFESTMATPLSSNLIAGPQHWMPQRYAYPVFDSETTPEQAYHQMADHELKTFLRTPDRSKFRDCGLVMDEKARLARFIEINASWDPRHCTFGSQRAAYIEAFFRATFDTWTNFVRTGRETHYVGYIPPIVMDADRFFADFPEGHMIHIVRNPWSGYADTIKRPFPFPLERYAQMWNVCSMQARVYERKYRGRFHVVLYENLIADPAFVMNPLCRAIGLEPFLDVPRPSFNRTPLDSIRPWGTIVSATPEANIATAKELSHDQEVAIYNETLPAAKPYGYDNFYDNLLW